MKTTQRLATALLALICTQTGITQERSPFGSTNPFGEPIHPKTENSSYVAVSPDKVTSLLPPQAKLEGQAQVIFTPQTKIGALREGASASWQINVQEAGSYVFSGQAATKNYPRDVSCFFSVGSISEKVKPVQTESWNQFVEIPLLETDLPKGQQIVKLTSHSGAGIDFSEIKITPKKLVAEPKEEPLFRKTEENPSISVPPDQITVLSPLQAKLGNRSRITGHQSLGDLRNGDFGSWQINVQEAGSYVIKARTSTRENPQNTSCVFSLGNISEQIRPFKTHRWEEPVEIQLLETDLPKGQQAVKITSLNNFPVDIFEIRIIPKKLISDLQNRPRFGMTKAELSLLWGEHTKTGAVFGTPMKGIKQEHAKYIDKSAPAVDFYIGKAGLAVSFYQDRVCGITVFGGWRAVEGMSMDELNQIAEVLCKVKFPKYPRNTKGDYTVYSTDMKQQYILQYKGGQATILHLPTWIQCQKEKESGAAPMKNTLEFL